MQNGGSSAMTSATGSAQSLAGSAQQGGQSALGSAQQLGQQGVTAGQGALQSGQQLGQQGLTTGQGAVQSGQQALQSAIPTAVPTVPPSALNLLQLLSGALTQFGSQAAGASGSKQAAAIFG